VMNKGIHDSYTEIHQLFASKYICKICIFDVCIEVLLSILNFLNEPLLVVSTMLSTNFVAIQFFLWYKTSNSIIFGGYIS
jgi:hypothetical protein